MDDLKTKFKVILTNLYKWCYTRSTRFFNGKNKNGFHKDLSTRNEENRRRNKKKERRNKKYLVSNHLPMIQFNLYLDSKPRHKTWIREGSSTRGRKKTAKILLIIPSLHNQNNRRAPFIAKEQPFSFPYNSHSNNIKKKLSKT